MAFGTTLTVIIESPIRREGETASPVSTPSAVTSTVRGVVYLALRARWHDRSIATITDEDPRLTHRRGSFFASR